ELDRRLYLADQAEQLPVLEDVELERHGGGHLKAFGVPRKRLRLGDLRVVFARRLNLREIEPHGTSQYTFEQGLGTSPPLRNAELLEEADGVAVGHAGEKIARRDVEPVGGDGAEVQEFLGPLANLFPESGQDAARLLELRRRHVVFVNRVEQERPKFEDGI